MPATDAQARVTALLQEDSMPSDTPVKAISRFWWTCFLMRSFFKLLKMDSATALSQKFPIRLIISSR